MNLQEAIIELTVHQEWRMNPEISMMVSKKTTEAIKIILDDHLHRQLETKPGFVEKREQLAWSVIEEMVANYAEEKSKFDFSEQLLCSPYDLMQYLKTICHPPMLK